MLITIEGKQGEGKTTIANVLGAVLGNEGYLVKVFDEGKLPTKTEIDAQTIIRNVLIVVKETQ